MDKRYDPHSVYGYDPETGVARTPPELHHEPRVRREPVESLTIYPCHGCGERMRPGDVVWVTVQQASHVVSVPAHGNHRVAARAAALEDKSWQHDQSHHSG